MINRTPLRKLGKNASPNRAFNSTLAIKKRDGLKKSPLAKMSAKTADIMPEYRRLVKRLKILSRGFSELSGEYIGADSLEPHHIDHRNGAKLTDVFNVILLSRKEHEGFTNGGWYKDYPKEELLAKVRRIRLAQGFEIKSVNTQ